MEFKFEIPDQYVQRFSELVSPRRDLPADEAIELWLEELVSPKLVNIATEDAHNTPEVIAAKTAYDQALGLKVEELINPPGVLQSLWDSVTRIFK